MSARPILDRLYSLGLIVTFDGDRLLVRPKENITPELRQAIREHKADIMRLLTDPSGGGPVYPSCESSLLQIPPKGTKSEDRPNRPEDGEGPPYPDGRGLVKCFYCTKVEIAGHRAVCKEIGAPLTGIALLRECERFAMKTIH
jgi:hypothetical protein